MRLAKVTVRYPVSLEETPATDTTINFSAPVAVSGWARDVSGYDTVDGSARQAVTFTEFYLPNLRVLQDANGNSLVNNHCEFVSGGRYWQVERALVVTADELPKQVPARRKKTAPGTSYLSVRARVRV